MSMCILWSGLHADT